MGGQKIYDYLVNQGYELSLGFVKSTLKSHRLVSKIVKTYKKKNKPHKSFENKLDRQFEVSDKVQVIPRVVCDITEWRMHNGTKFYLCAATELATRSIVGYKTALTCEAELVTEVIDQVQAKLPGENDQRDEQLIIPGQWPNKELRTMYQKGSVKTNNVVIE